MGKNSRNSLHLTVSVFNALGYAIAVSVPTYLDPLLKSHVRYGARTYQAGYWPALISVPILIATYYLMGF